VSSSRQVNEGAGLDIQRDACINFIKSKYWCIHRIYTDKALSGKNTERPDFQRLMEAAQRKAFDCVVCYKIDRFSRSLIDLLNTLKILNDNEIKFISATEPIDTASVMGQTFLQLLGVFAEFERKLIKERMDAGKRKAESEGKVTHRPSFKVTNPGEYNQMLVLRKQGSSLSQLAQLFHKSPSSIKYILEHP
jgi:site-specific DNA recombinase